MKILRRSLFVLGGICALIGVCYLGAEEEDALLPEQEITYASIVKTCPFLADEKNHIVGAVNVAAKRYNLPPQLLFAMMYVESRCDTRARSPRGASGLLQLMPATATAMGVQNGASEKQHIMGAARYLSQMRARFGTLELSLAAYNAGPSSVVRYSGVPPYRETRRYISRVRRVLAQLENKSSA